MLLKMITKNVTLLSFLGCMLFAGVLLFPNLGRFGMWEPDEMKIAETAGAEGGGAVFARLEQQLATLGWELLGRNEWGSRLPIAVLGMLTAALLFWVIWVLGDIKLALMGTIFYISAPFFIFHAKQLTGGMPSFAAELLSIGGLAIAFMKSGKLRLIGGTMALAGIVLGCAARGVLVGGTVPLFTISAALIVSKQNETVENRLGRLAPYLLCAGGLLLVGLYYSVVFGMEGDIVWITGGLDSAVQKSRTFDFALEQIVYGWYPWIVFLPISIVPLFRSKEDAPVFLRMVVLFGVLFGYLAQVLALDVSGLAPSAVGLPVALGIALAVNDLRRDTSPDRFLVFIAAAMLAVLIRDFAQNNQALMYGYGFDQLDIPKKDFEHVIWAGLFTIPFALLILTAFIAQSRWQKRLFSMLLSLSPLVFGGFLSFGLVPMLSVQLSSKHAIEVYKEFRTNNEPLAVYGNARMFTDATKLKSSVDVVKWLTREERVFIVFPPDKLADFDQKLRKKSGEHIFVLDAKSDRFYVATSKPNKGETNQNPIAPFVQSKPFDKKPRHETSVNFDDTVTLIGWDVESDGQKDRLKKGAVMTFTSYWHVARRFSADYKIFMHIDGAGGRVHGDHEPFDGKFPTTRWQKGDYIKEVFKKEIPLYQGTGEYTIRMGLYNNKGRLSVKDEPSAKENSVLITSLKLE